MSEAPEKAPFTVKAFPVEARLRAGKAAAQRGESMGEWMARAVHVLADMEAGDRVYPPVKPNGKPSGLDGKPDLTEDQRTARIQALAAMMQGLAAVKTATGRASGKEVVMQEVWALRTKQIPYRPRAPIHNGSTEPPTDSVDGTAA